MSKVHWMPLESNPDVMNTFVWKLGVSPKYQFTDVFGLDPELLCMVPQPCLAIILLFPITDNYKQFCEKEGVEIDKHSQKLSSDLFFMKQTIGNACGTIGVIHAIANNRNRVEISPGSVFENFLTETLSLTPEEKGKRLEKDTVISKLHEEMAQEGQTAAMNPNDTVDLHFVALAHVDGSLYEFDGRKSFPINHGMSSADTFLEDAAKLCREFMERDKTELRFTIVALSEM